MSFILDALRKSENERQKSAVPGVSVESQGGAKNHLPPWAIVTMAGLAVALVAVAGGWWLSGRDADQPPAATRSQSIPDPSERPKEVRSLAQEAKRAARTQAPRATAQTAAAKATRPANATETPTPAASAETEAADTAPLPPTIDEAIAGGLNIPHLNLDIHVYTPSPSERFVFVNARKYREGETLTEGPRVVEITDSGVLLNYQDERFLLPRD